MIFFSFYFGSNSINLTTPPARHPPGRMFTTITTLPHLHVIGCLLCAFVNGGHLSPGVFSFHRVFVQFDNPNDEATSSHMLHPGHFSSKTYLPLQPPRSVDCCLFIFKWQPPKAKDQHISLFLMWFPLAPQTSTLNMAPLNLTSGA
jgi:hypothetical protein